MTQTKKKKIILYLVNSFLDPVIESNVMLYIREAAKSGDYQFTVVSYEQESFRLSPEEQTAKKEELAKNNVFWEPLDWSLKKPKLRAKFIDLLSALSTLRKLKKSGHQYMITLNSVAASYGYIFSKIFGFKLYPYQYEPHSEYGRDAGLWTESSLSFKVLSWLEKKAAMRATVISSGTDYMKNRLLEWKTPAKFFKIASVVNDTFFDFSESNRLSIRKKLNLSADKKVILYAGKFGDLYYTEEVGTLFKTIYDNIENVYFLVLTLNDIDEISEMFKKAGIPDDLITVTRSTYQEMPGYLSTADLGVVAVPPVPSKIFCSNIKFGEYLATGLPYLICKGVSEDDRFADEQRVGISVKDFETTSITPFINDINTYLNTPRIELAKRCRQACINYRGFNMLNGRFQEALRTLTSD